MYKCIFARVNQMAVLEHLFPEMTEGFPYFLMKSEKSEEKSVESPFQCCFICC